MAEPSKFDELRAKTDRELLQLINKELDLEHRTVMRAPCGRCVVKSVERGWWLNFEFLPEV